jgi:membrane protein implicated in regulation of membrane protease activity
MAFDPTNGLLFFFTVVMVLPLSVYFFAERLSRNKMLDLILKRAMLALFFIIGSMCVSVVGIIAKTASLGLENIAWMLLYLFNLAFWVALIAIFYLTCVDAMRMNKAGKQRDPDKHVAEQEDEEDEDSQ